MKRIVEVRQTTLVEVEVDETKFTPEWMEEWRGVFYDFHTVEDHIQHIAQLKARYLLRPEFTEGYGPLTGPKAEIEIRAEVISEDLEMEIQRDGEGVS